MAAALEAGGPGALTLLEEHVPGLAAAAEQVGHLLDMAAADDAAEEARNKKRAAAADSDDDRRAKLVKVGVEAGGFNKDKIAISVVGVTCF
jgi:cleavage stimulation factor subunit 2